MKMKEEEDAPVQTDSLTTRTSEKEEHPSFSSLPDEMVVKCLAHISASYYPKLSLVSTRFHFIFSSHELHLARTQLKTRENVLYVSLQLPCRRLPSWFSLWLRPDQILTNDIEEKNMSTGHTMLVGMPSQYSPLVPTLCMDTVGFKTYAVVQDNTPPTSSPMYVRDERSVYPVWCKAPSMKVARENPLANILDEKIYVMGGCNADESKNWAEVFDTKTQTWVSLPDPGPELRFSLLKKVFPREGKVYVSSSSKKNDYFYDPKERRWGVGAGVTVIDERSCMIDDVIYFCSEEHCLWLDAKRKAWRVVKGLEVLCKNCCASSLAIDNYGGKLLILWDKFEKPDQCENKNIWCSVIAVGRCNGDDEVWGNVEWASVVLTVSSSYVLLSAEVIQVDHGYVLTIKGGLN